MPPDVHGEYVPTDVFYGPGSPWPDRLLDGLGRTIGVRDKFISAAIISAALGEEVREKADPRQLHDAIMRLVPQVPRNRVGLAQFLAERGLLPMYGMPTRVRDLYLTLMRDGDGIDAEYFWSSIDRDQEMAIFEFAPGSILVKDKRKHLAIGFTGPLLDPELRGNTNTIDLGNPTTSWFGDEAYVARCLTCGAAKHEIERPQHPLVCDDCQRGLQPDDFQRYLTPSAFRTEFRDDHEMEDVGQMALRTIATVLREGQPSDHGGIRVHRGAGATVMHLNDGIEDEHRDPTFFHVDVVTDNRPFMRRRTTPLPEQAIDSAVT